MLNTATRIYRSFTGRRPHIPMHVGPGSMISALLRRNRIFHPGDAIGVPDVPRRVDQDRPIISKRDAAEAYAYPAAMRPTCDLLRRRMCWYADLQSSTPIFRTLVISTTFQHSKRGSTGCEPRRDHGSIRRSDGGDKRSGRFTSPVLPASADPLRRAPDPLEQAREVVPVAVHRKDLGTDHLLRDR